MKNFLTGSALYVSFFLFVPGFTFCALAAFALFPTITPVLVIFFGVLFSMVFAFYMKDLQIAGNTAEHRKQETIEYHRAIAGFHEPSYVPNQVYTQGRIFIMQLDGRRYEAYLLDEKFAMLTDSQTEINRVITIVELRQMRGEANTQERRRMLGR